jgi:hypothetical protein
MVLKRQSNLTDVVRTGHPAGGLSGRLDRRQQQSNKNPDDRDDQRQLKQRKAAGNACDVRPAKAMALPGCSLVLRLYGLGHDDHSFAQRRHRSRAFPFGHFCRPPHPANAGPKGLPQL